MNYDTGFGVVIEVLVGESHSSYNLRNNLSKMQTKLGRVKNGSNNR